MANILSIDQGTTSSRAIVFSKRGKVLAEHQQDFKQIFPENGWVEHKADDIWQTVLTCCKQALKKVDNKVHCLGISNQRETTLIWRRDTGKPIYNAIVWQDRRTADYCRQLKKSGVSDVVGDKTGLLLDPYFSATKIAWILKNVAGAMDLAKKGKLCFGTVDSYLIWQLSGGKKHVTDVTNASRTMLFNIETLEWDTDLLRLFAIPAEILPQVLKNTDKFAVTDKSILGVEIPICGVAGDQQAASIGQACFKTGMAKSTYGTGCFVMVNTGKKIIPSKCSLLSTVAYQIENKLCYALEGSIFNAGTTIQWLRDQLHFIKHSKDCEKIAAKLQSNHGVYLVPAFTGLGAPYWDSSARAAIVGITRDTNDKHIVRAGLESVCYQTKALLDAIQADGVKIKGNLRVDGGMVANNWLLQFLSDILQISVERPTILETSAHGAAYLAALGSGLYKDLQEVSECWRCDKIFESQLSPSEMKLLYKGWEKAVEQVLT